ADLEQDVDLLLRQPVRLAGLPPGPQRAAARIDLAALHGEVDLGAGVAADDLELGPGDAVQDARVERRGRGRAAGADDQLLLLDLIDAGDAGRVPGHDGQRVQHGI